MKPAENGKGHNRTPRGRLYFAGLGRVFSEGQVRALPGGPASPPRRISYRHALMLIRNFWVAACLATPGVLPRRLDALLSVALASRISGAVQVVAPLVDLMI